MLRRLSAIEIAEGALLADIAVIFQLLVTYLPIGGDFFRIFIFIVFTVLVLRRGLYVGIMAMFVSMFIAGVITGPQNVITMMLETTGGLFLGLTMKYRMRHVPLILLGVTGGALASYVLILLIFFLSGLPITNIIHSLHKAYDTGISFINALAPRLGLGGWWRQSAYPAVKALMNWAFVYWWALYYVAIWMIMVPVVTVIYFSTNVFVRRLGYNVRPFPEGRMHRWFRRIGRSLLKRAIRRRRALRKEYKKSAERREAMKQEVNI